MIYIHHQKAIDYITDKFRSDPQVNALLVSGSIAHGFNDKYSDIDINIIVSDSVYEQKMNNNAVTYWESAARFYKDGYFDGKYITLDYLNTAAERGSEPARFALRDSLIAFDKTGLAADCIARIGTYDTGLARKNTVRFLSQFEGWKWYCDEAIKRKNKYLLETSVSRLILFSGRLILAFNKIFFPYHKWFLKVLETAPCKPPKLMKTIYKLLDNKNEKTVNELYKIIKEYKDWTNGAEFNWSSHFVHDIETVWIRNEDFIENI